MTEPAVSYESQDHIGVLTLNRPDNRNSMTPELLDAFAEAVDRARADTDIRCLLVTGRGRSFSAGADFKSALQRDQGSGRRRLPHERSYSMYEPFLKVLDVEVPVIAALNGHAIGGGFGLAMACDIRIANENAKYGANFAKLGMSSGMAISYLLPRLVGVSMANELLFTGRLVQGDEAARIGLASRAVSGEQVFPQAMELAGQIASAAPIAVAMVKRTLYRGLGWDVRGAALEEAYAQAATLQTDDAQEGMDALLNKRDPVFRGT